MLKTALRTVAILVILATLALVGHSSRVSKPTIPIEGSAGEGTQSSDFFVDRAPLFLLSPSDLLNRLCSQSPRRMRITPPPTAMTVQNRLASLNKGMSPQEVEEHLGVGPLYDFDLQFRAGSDYLMPKSYWIEGGFLVTVFYRDTQFFDSANFTAFGNGADPTVRPTRSNEE